MNKTEFISRYGMPNTPAGDRMTVDLDQLVAEAQLEAVEEQIAAYKRGDVDADGWETEPGTGSETGVGTGLDRLRDEGLL